MRIAVDAMGGDHAPKEIVAGAVRAARSLDSVSTIHLVGDKDRIQHELDSLGSIPDLIEIHHASQVVEMHEKPAMAVRRKKDSSVGRAIDLVKSGDADAIVSAGNTGGVVAASTLKLRALEGVTRPAIAAIMPTQGRPLVLIDAGANTDCDPNMVRQFAVMGAIYSRTVLSQKDPVVGLLSIGGEETKGNDSTREIFGLLQQTDVNFRGNVEGHDLFLGETDVVVCDGFVGNIVLKTSESVAHAFGHWMKREFKASPLRMMGALLLRGGLRVMKDRLDPEMHGGAPLLGVNGVCIITHGASSGNAIYHAIRVAACSVNHHINDQIVSEVSKLGGS